MNTRSKTIAISLAITLFAMQGAESAAKTSVTVKKAGRATTQTLNTILSGSGVPAKSIGINGDLYIDIKNANLYGPKTKGAWKVVTSLKTSESKNKVAPVSGAVGAVGAKGATGDRGLNGATGDRGSTGAIGATGATGATGNSGAKGDTGLTGASGIVGSAGTTGAQGLSGAVGAKGDSGLNGTPGATGVRGLSGATGATGNPGAKGDSGLTGASGIVGSAGTTGAQGLSGAVGAKGDAGVNGTPGATGAAGPAGSTGVTGIAGATGTPGANGAAGVKGDTGLTGSAGISNSYFVDIPQWALSTSVNSGTSDSAQFGTLIGSRAYTFEIVLDGTFSPGTATLMSIGMQLIASVTPISLQYRVFTSDSTSFINSVGGRHYQFLIIGAIVCGSSTTSLTLRAIDQYGATASNMLSFSGKILINRVEVIG